MNKTRTQLFIIFVLLFLSSSLVFAQEGAIFKNSAGDTVLIVDESNNVGIGFSLPTYKLHIRSHSNSNDGITLDNSGNGFPQLLFRDTEYADMGKFFWDDNNDVMKIESEGELSYRILSNPPDGEPIFRVMSSGSSERLRVEHNGYTTTTNEFGVEGNGESYISGDLRIDNNLKMGAFDIFASDSLNLRIKHPEAINLQLYADSDNSGDETPKITLSQNSGNVNGDIGLIGSAGQQFTGSLNNSFYLHRGGAGEIQFSTNSTARMTILGGGNVGIRTNSPDEALSVVGKVRGSNSDAENNYVEISHGGSNGYVRMNGTGNLDLRHGGTTAISIASDGKVGINTSTPEYKLDIDGWLGVRNDAYFMDKAEFQANAEFQAHAFFLCGGTEKYWQTIWVNGGDGHDHPGLVPQTDGWGYLGLPGKRWKKLYCIYTRSLFRGTLSDNSIRENVRPIENSLDKIKNLNAISYDLTAEAFGEDNDRTQYNWQNRYGFVAQDVEKVFPNMVEEDKDDGLKVINYEELIPVLVEAMKEQQTQIEQLKAKVEQLESNK